MKIGFTGTQAGMTSEQKETLSKMLKKYHIDEAHHGDCIGADAEFHEIIKELGVPIVIHPPLKEDKRAHCEGGLILEPQEYMTRNQAIVDSVQMLFATPKDYTEKLRSGTWSTIRKARKKCIVVYLIRPNGKLRREL